MTSKIKYGTTEWRVQVAALAHKFFSLQHSETAARWLGKTFEPNALDPWAVVDFLHYITKIGIESSGGGEDLTTILGGMERAGLLVQAGWHPEVTLLGQQYIAQHRPNAQKNGDGRPLSQVDRRSLRHTLERSPRDHVDGSRIGYPETRTC
jgi:hypothetical protein